LAFSAGPPGPLPRPGGCRGRGPSRHVPALRALDRFFQGRVLHDLRCSFEDGNLVAAQVGLRCAARLRPRVRSGSRQSVSALGRALSLGVCQGVTVRRAGLPAARSTVSSPSTHTSRGLSSASPPSPCQALGAAPEGARSSAGHAALPMLRPSPSLEGSSHRGFSAPGRGQPGPLHTPLLPFLTASAARSARRAAGLLHPAADLEVHGVSTPRPVASSLPGRSIPVVVSVSVADGSSPCRLALRSVPPARSHPSSRRALALHAVVDARPHAASVESSRKRGSLWGCFTARLAFSSLRLPPSPPSRPSPGEG